MIRFFSHHWPQLSALGVFYCLLAAGLGYLTNAQLDAMQTQVDTLQYVNYSGSRGF